MVIDGGLHPDFAVRLARDFAKVYYYVPPSGGAFQTINAATIGKGLEGIEVVDTPFIEQFNKVDLFVVTDIHFGPLQVHLESLGKKVWGSRMGEELELERDATKKVMQKVGLPVNGYKVVRGMDPLREYLKDKKNVYVKVSRYRGTFESFKVTNYRNVEPLLDSVEGDIGPLKTEIDFIVEEDLPDRIEIGIDAWTVDGIWPESVYLGIEVKDAGYVGVFKDWKDIPEEVRRWNEKMSPIFAKYGYKGAISTEVRIGKDHEPYMIDATCRNPSPPSEAYAEAYLNIAEIIWMAANGKMVKARPAAKFICEAIIKSSWAVDMKWQPIDFPNKYRKNIKLHCACKIGGRYYIVPQTYQLEEIGAVVGWGDTMEAAIKQVEEIADTIEGYGIKVHTQAFQEAQGEMDKTNEIGLKVF
jgi:phosphoribosylamine-glycine ligase